MYTRLMIAVLIGGLLLVLGCADEREIVSPTYQDQILGFINDTEDGRQLFSNDLFPNVPFARDDGADRYYYVTDSVNRSIQVTIGTVAKDIPPYQDIYDALANVVDLYYGRVMRISGSDTAMAYKFRTSVQRYGYFLKLFDDSFPSMGWRFRGFYSPGNEINANRRIISSNGQFSIEADGQFNGPPSPLGAHTENYILYDTIPIFTLGDSLTFFSLLEDRFSVRTSPTAVKTLYTSLNNMTYRAGWRTSGGGEPFNRLILVEGEERFWVDTVDYGIPIVESTLIRQDDYVVFYKVQ